MERESEGKISYDHTIEAALVLRTHWQVRAEVNVRQLRVNLGPEIAACFSNSVGQHL